MKKYLFISIILIAIVACKKGDIGPAGPQGSQGYTGPQGPQGVAGNANVMQYTFGAQNFNTNSSIQLFVTTSQDTMNRSQWFVYFFAADRWLFLPGIGNTGNFYRVTMGYGAGKVIFYIDRFGSVSESFTKARVIRIYANGETTGGRMAVDFTDYEAMRRYYNLPD